MKLKGIQPGMVMLAVNTVARAGFHGVGARPVVHFCWMVKGGTYARCIRQTGESFVSHRRRTTTEHMRDLHALRRAIERYGAYLSRRDLDELASKVRKGNARFVRRVSGTRTEWLVVHHGKTFRVGYSKSTKQITTFLPINSKRGVAQS